MSDLSAIQLAAKRALEALGAPVAKRASEWADAYFYLSEESSYVEGRWRTWPFQRAILDCMGHDGIPNVTFRKSARVGYSKMLLACLAYMAEHKRRNQVVYQPTDEDAEDWVKTELDTMLRDVTVMRRVFPSFLRRSKDNTLRQKCFLGSRTFIRGGTAAKNFRRLTVDVVYLDELDGFDRDIEKEGSPTRLSEKRLEGATFPKQIKGSTPKLRGLSLIDEEHDAAEAQFRFHVPCPHCGHEQPLEWGGEHERHGFKWAAGDPDSVVHMCARCGVGFAQAQYLAVWEHGRWIAPNGVWIDRDCVFRSAAGAEIKPPQSVAFSLWTAYSPQATWPAIVREFLQASELKRRGDHTAIKTFTNTTLGQSFKLEGAAHSAAVLQARAKSETYLLRRVPRGGLILVAGVDVQDNRFHIVVWAFGREEEMWVVDRRVMWCDPGAWQSWVDLDVYLSTRFPHEGGQTCAIDCVGVDIGGHYTHQVYRYAMLRESRRVHATQGSSQDGRPIVAGAPTRQDVNVDGQIVKEGVKLWRIGTDTAKDRIFNILRNVQPGPGFMHFSRELESDFFHQITAEERVEQKTARGVVHRWVKPNAHTRNEDLDCTVIALFCAARMKLHQYTDAEWRRLEDALCPPTADLFAYAGADEEGAAPALPPNGAADSGPVAEPPPMSVPPLLLPAARGRRVRGLIG